MSCRPFFLLAGSLAMGCAPALPPRPELPPITAQVGEAHEVAAPVLTEPDLSTESSRIRVAEPMSNASRAASQGRS